MDPNKFNMATHLGIETERNELYYIRIWNMTCLFAAGWAAGMVTAAVILVGRIGP